MVQVGAVRYSRSRGTSSGTLGTAVEVRYHARECHEREWDMRRCPPLRLASFLSSPASRLHPSRGRLQQLLRTERERPLAPLQQRLFVKRRFLSTSAPKSPDCTAGVDFSWVMTFKGAASCASYVLVPYVGVLLFLVAQQRSLIFPRSTRTASIAKSGGELIKVPLINHMPVCRLLLLSVATSGAFGGLSHGR